MKKIWILALMLMVLGTTTVQAQIATDTVDMQASVARMKEWLKPQLVEKVKLTDIQADKVIDIFFAGQVERRKLRDLSADERREKMQELIADRDKKLAAIPLTPGQVKEVNDFFTMRREGPQRANQQ